MLKHALGNVRSDSEKDYHLAFELERIYDRVSEDGRLSEETKNDLDDIDDEILIAEIYPLVEKWYSDHEFDAVREVKPLLRDGIDSAIDKDWFTVAAEYYYQLSDLQSGLSGHNANTEMRDALSFLQANRQQVRQNTSTRIIDLISRNFGDIDDSRRDEWIDFVQTAREQARSNNQFRSEREYLRKLHGVRKSHGEDTDSIENLLIESYRQDADIQAKDSSLGKASTLQSGLDECMEYMSDEKIERWKHEVIDAREKGVKNEMVALDLENLPMSNYDGNLMEDLEKMTKGRTEEIKKYFKDLRNKNNSYYAFYCLLCFDDIIPDVARMRLNSEQFVGMEIFSRKIFSPEFNTLSRDPSDDNGLPNNYRMKAMSPTIAMADALYQLIKGGHLTLAQFKAILSISDALSADTEAFVTDALLHLFDDNHVESMFISLPHIEGAMCDALVSAGKTTYKTVEDGTEQRSLGGLISSTKELDIDYSTYLRYRYTSKEGENLRNRAAHGLLRYHKVDHINSVMALYDLLRIVVHIKPSPFGEKYGFPQRSLYPPTSYPKNHDLTLYTDANIKIVGYGETSDKHTFIVIRKDRNGKFTELFVDRGRISDYTLGDGNMSKDDIESKIDDLSDDYPEIPSDIDYEWFTDERTKEELMKIIEAESANGSDEIQHEEIFKQARAKGIDESTVRVMFHRLEDDGNIEKSEDTVSLAD